MSSEVRHTEKRILFSLLRAQSLDPELVKSNEFNDVVFQLIAAMESDDVQAVEKLVSLYMQRRKGS